jgi:predicted phosphodiesterase
MNEIWSFVYVADMQPGSPKSFRYNPAWQENWETARKQIIEIQPEFILVGGDVTRDGSIHHFELEEMKLDFDNIGIPYYVIPGNMDTGNKHATSQGPDNRRSDLSLNITSSQLKTFEEYFGPSQWSFDYKNVRVSGFCDMLLGSGLPEEKKLWKWLEEQSNRPKAEHQIWLMHYAMFINDINEPDFDITQEESYLDWYFSIDHASRKRLLEIFKASNAERVITGHIHCRKDFFAKGIYFDLAPGTCSGQWENKWPDGDASLGFFRYDVAETGLSKTFVPLQQVSDRKDAYGPGGHPKPEVRDYSIAWEKI